MLRRLTYLLTLSLALPAIVNAATTWTVKATSAQPAMGSVSPSGYANFTTNTVKTFRITPVAGNAVLKVLLNNVDQGKLTSVDVPYRSTMQTLTAYFAVQTFQVTAVQSSGGAITSTTATAVAYGKSKTFTIKPNTGNTILQLKDNGADVAITDPAGMNYTIASVTADHTITAVFKSISVEAGMEESVITGKGAALKGSATSPAGTITSYAWSVASGPAGTTAGVTNSASASATFTPDVAGMYVLRLTATDSAGNSASDTVKINAFDSAAAASNQCSGCHSGTTAGTQLLASYSASIHKDALTCTGCHEGAETTAHPGSVTSKTVNSTTFKDSSGKYTYADATGNYYCLNSACHTTTNIWTRDLSKSSHFATANGGNCSSCHSSNMHNPASTFTDGCGQCHTETANTYASKHFTGSAAATFEEGQCRSCHTGNVGYGYSTTADYTNGVFTRPSSARASKHRPETWKYTTSAACATCHTDLKTKFEASTHWNNHLESGSEFTGGEVEGQLNANESWATAENGTLTTCATRCHFKPNLGPNPNAKDSMAVNRPGKDACLACHDPHQLKATYETTCLECHSGSRHGKVPNEFFASKHWQNNFEYGAEFANQLNTAVAGGKVTSDGSTVDGVLNANDSYTTTENGSTVTCAYRCHFRPGMGPVPAPAAYVADGKAITYVTYTDTLGSYTTAGTVFSRPGGNACIACHDEHGLAANAQSTCYTCHAGGNHGWSVKAFEKSTHFTGEYAKADGMAKDACLACHNPHSTEATFGAYSSLTPVAATGCQTCHTPGSPYGIYNVDQSGKAPHFQIGTADANGYFPTASYITAGGATCADCHYHNNSPNAGWAEGGHGSVTAVPWKSDASHNWNNQGTDGVNYQASPQKTNCIRCHSARGFAQYWDSGFSNIDKVYLDPVAKTLDKASAPLVCSGCHTSFKGAVRPLPAGYAKVKSFYGYSTVAIAPAKMVATLEFTDNKNSNICIPCHSQRAIGAGIKALFAQGAFKQYSVGTNMYPHAAQPAAIVDGKGGYEFASAQGYQDRMRHIRIGNNGTGTGYNNTGVTSGNCAGCHMTSPKTHALEAVTADATTGQLNGIASTLCVNCHPTAFTYQDIQTKKDAFNAAVAALGNLLVKKGITLDGVNVLPERKPFDMSLGTKDNAVAEKNTGAWFNWYLFKTADTAAYVHNPAYSRRLIFDSIDWLDDNVMNNSSANTVLAMANTPTSQYYNPTVITTQTATQAVAQLNNPGCMGCHFGTGSTLSGEAVPGVEQAPHFNTTAALVPGQTFTQAQFVTPGTQCNYCHGYGHGTDSPNYSAVRADKALYSSMSTASILQNYAESAHGDINGLAWTDYDFKTRSGGCVVCHTTAGFVKGVSNNFAAGVSAPFGAGDTTKQVLGCDACHSSTAWKTSVRTIAGGYNAVYGGDYGAAPTASVNYVQYEDVGESNICITCHASRENGTSLANGVADFANASFKNPHYLGAAAVFYGKGGFQWYTSNTGKLRYQTYGAVKADGTVQVGRNANWSHGKLGMGNYSTAKSDRYPGRIVDSGNKGQCVSCHMGPANTHTFGAAETAKSTNGTNTTTLGGCYGCHTSEPIEELIEGEKKVYDRAMDFFDWTLRQNNMVYTEAYPYFQNTVGGALKNWTFGGGVGPAVGTGAQNMGAAMNYKLLKAEKGAHVHNRAFTRALIFDSVQYLQNGTVFRPAANADVNQILNFTSYSTARTAAPDGNPTSINQLKGYLTKSSGGMYTAR